jgi:predicted acylesterase/phospholipase RssA
MTFFSPITQLDRVHHVVFPGAGVRGVALCSAMDMLLSTTTAGDFFRRLEGAAGTSIGALLALACTMRSVPAWRRVSHRMQAAETWCNDRLAQSVDLLHVNENLSLCSSATLDWLIQAVVEEDLGLDMHMTLAQLEEKTSCRYVCNASRFDSHANLILSAESTPELTLYMALRMTMALPGIFPAVPFRRHLWVDGGLVRNVLVDALDKAGKNTLAFVFMDDDDEEEQEKEENGTVAQQQDNHNNNIPHAGFFGFMRTVVLSSMLTPARYELRGFLRTHRSAILPIRTPHVGPLAFPVTPMMVDTLRRNGQQAILDSMHVEPKSWLFANLLALILDGTRALFHL